MYGETQFNVRSKFVIKIRFNYIFVAVLALNFTREYWQLRGEVSFHEFEYI